MNISYDECLRAALSDNPFYLESLKAFDHLNASSKTWSDDQRVEFLTRSKHHIGKSHIEFGDSIRVMRTAIAVGASVTIPEYTMSSSASRDISLFLLHFTQLSDAAITSGRVLKTDPYEILINFIFSGNASSPLSAYILWHSL